MASVADVIALLSTTNEIDAQTLTDEGNLEITVFDGLPLERQLEAALLGFYRWKAMTDLLYERYAVPESVMFEIWDLADGAIRCNNWPNIRYTEKDGWVLND